MRLKFSENGEKNDKSMSEFQISKQIDNFHDLVKGLV